MTSIVFGNIYGVVELQAEQGVFALIDFHVCFCSKRMSTLYNGELDKIHLEMQGFLKLIHPSPLHFRDIILLAIIMHSLRRGSACLLAGWLGELTLMMMRSPKSAPQSCELIHTRTAARPPNRQPASQVQASWAPGTRNLISYRCCCCCFSAFPLPLRSRSFALSALVTMADPARVRSPQTDVGPDQDPPSVPPGW